MTENEITQGIRQKIEELNALASQAGDLGLKVEIHVIELEQIGLPYDKLRLQAFVWKFLDPNCR